MPSGYTCDVQNGKITTLREFALLCARHFGACITLRDEPLSTDVPEFTVDKHHDERLERTQADIDEWKATSERKRREMWQDHISAERQRYEHRLSEMQSWRERYEAMLDAARKWKPPTAEHTNLRKFMIEQLTSSMEWDCHDIDDPESPSFEAWEAEHERELYQSHSWALKNRREEIERVQGRNEWIRALVRSLE